MRYKVTIPKPPPLATMAIPTKLWSKHVTERTLACTSVESIDTFSWQAKLVTNIGVFFFREGDSTCFLNYVNAVLFGGRVEQQRGSVTLEKLWLKHGVSRTSIYEASLGCGRRRVSWEAMFPRTCCYYAWNALNIHGAWLYSECGFGRGASPPQKKARSLMLGKGIWKVHYRNVQI